MFIKDVCNKCNLTKKAIEYYEEQGLIFPTIGDNGYRNYTADDILILKEIAVLRKLNISVADIKNITTSNNKVSALARYKYKMDLEVQKSIAKKTCLEQLLNDYNINQAIDYIEENIERNFTIKERLLQAFPGPYGMYICIHFGQFLDDKIETKEKEEAYYKIINWLDKIKNIEFSDELEEHLLKSFELMEQRDMEKMNDSLLEAVDNMDVYLEDNKKNIDEYLKLRNSDEFKNSIAFKMHQSLVGFLQNNGYYDILIPNLKILSDSYREYCEKLEVANKIFVEKYPKAKDIYNEL
ncbi:MerR family transcriptional regulator [Clostridium brassicae]|uniref:MerR family transcriptional regulator n=1 Tax=Clostridium brassicae TaxID=2999072 RepID=A0ABT4D8R4_9CLOT|nr:MerR family transcriptional regulator [Clostridium brassicae]MCY6958676.1 MerR family transcriptional regulator [Clostridium brassicae]